MQKEYTIHSALVAQQSKKLHALVNNGQMKEATERRVVWEDADEETFIRFSQFAYTGFYDEEETTGPEVVEGSLDEVRPESVEWGWGNINKRGVTSGFGGFQEADTQPRNKKSALWVKFTALYPPPSPIATASIDSLDEAYIDVFLRHARIYVFADYHGIDALQTLALQKLGQALSRFEPSTHGSSDTVQLVKYCFEHTVDNGEQQTDRLRSLVCFYVACKLEKLWKDPEIQGLTSAIPEFSKGLISILIDRMD